MSNNSVFSRMSKTKSPTPIKRLTSGTSSPKIFVATLIISIPPKETVEL
jgi:hypothetical protein